MKIQTVVRFPKKYMVCAAAALCLCLLLTFFLTGNAQQELQYVTYDINTNSPFGDEEKVAYLTFDDGPSAISDLLLDTLKAADVKATFFVVSQTNIEQAERDRLFKRTVDEGHLLALHAFSHADYRKIYQSGRGYFDGLLTLQKEILDATGYESKVFRFPAGSGTGFCSKASYKEIGDLSKEHGFTFYDWNVDAQDAVGGHKSKETLIQKVVNDSKKLTTPVILMHDMPACKSSTEAVPEIVRQLKEAGYRFDTMDHFSKTLHQNRK